MSKHDNDHDDTPIVFAEPKGSHTRIPHPINQPFWRYNTNPRATKAAIIMNWIQLVAMLIASGLFCYEAFINSSWHLAIVAICVILLTYWFYMRYLAPKDTMCELDGSSGSSRNNPAKRKKKYPKHRKDYR